VIGRDQLELWSRGLARFRAAQAKHEPAQFFDVDYADFLRDPAGTVEASLHQCAGTGHFRQMRVQTVTGGGAAAWLNGALDCVGLEFTVMATPLVTRRRVLALAGFATAGIVTGCADASAPAHPVTVARTRQPSREHRTKPSTG
jgi:hypothetical protein